MRLNKGFTLIELIVVIAILAILAVALIPLVNNFIEKSRVSRVMTAVSSLESAVVAFNADVGRFPSDEEALINESELVQNLANVTTWNGPYLSKNVDGLSPWGTTYQLTATFSFLGNDENKLDYFLDVNSDGTEETLPPASSITRLDQNFDGENNLEAGRVQLDGEFLSIAIVPDYGNEEDGSSGPGGPPLLE